MKYVVPTEYVETGPHRMPWDFVNGMYYRSELDRGIGGLQSEVWQTLGMSLTHTIDEQYKNDGYLCVLDVGCGTGRHLWDIQDRRYEDSPNVRLFGISKEDYSEESELWRVRSAMVTGDIGYALCDITEEALPLDTFNVVYSYELMTHLDETVVCSAVRNMVNTLSPGGKLFFNANGTQRTDIIELLDSMQDTLSYEVGSVKPPDFEQFMQDADPARIQTRDVYAVTKFATV